VAVPAPDRFVVCGLGGLGQHGIAMLREFGVMVSAVDRAPPDDEEVPGWREMLDGVVVGDCRDGDVLRRAGVAEARGILVVTPDERVNVETAFAARRLQPGIRLVVRCSRERLNALLQKQLGNFVAFEPTHLAAPAFALAATEDDVVGLFRLAGRVLRVVERRVDDGDRGIVGRPAVQLDSRSRRIVSLRQDPAVTHAGRLPIVSRALLDRDPEEERGGGDGQDVPFHRFDPEAIVAAGDVVTTVELADQGAGFLRPSGEETPAPGGAGNPGARPTADVSPSMPRAPFPSLRRGVARAHRALRDFFSPAYPYPIARIALVIGATVATLVTAGALVLAATVPDAGVVDGFYGAIVLLLGGYADRFEDFDGTGAGVPWWVRGYALLLTVSGTALVGVVYAMVTEKLLTMRMAFLSRRPPVPKEGHVVVAGLGRVGQRVAEILGELGIPVVGVSASGVGPDVLPWLPVVTGRAARQLDAVHLERALGLVASTADDMDNLETALLAHGRAPRARLVIRASDARFSVNVSSLLPYANVLCGTALTAEVFAAAAFGENVLSLFRLAGETVMVTDYRIDDQDTLHGLLVGDVAHGYGLVPLLFERDAPATLGSDDDPREGTRHFLPPDELRLEPGDRLVVLATSTSLQRVESGRRFPRRFGVAVEGTLTPDAVLGGAAEISRRTGASIAEARAFMDARPGVFHRPLHHRQAVDLVRSLKRHQVRADVVALPRSSTNAEVSATVPSNSDAHDDPLDSEPDADADRVPGRY